MKSMLLLSVVLVALIAPLIIARDPNPFRGLRKLIVTLVVFNVLYLYYLTELMPVMYVPHWP